MAVLDEAAEHGHHRRLDALLRPLGQAVERVPGARRQAEALDRPARPDGRWRRSIARPHNNGARRSASRAMRIDEQVGGQTLGRDPRLARSHQEPRPARRHGHARADTHLRPKRRACPPTSTTRCVYRRRTTCEGLDRSRWRRSRSSPSRWSATRYWAPGGSRPKTRTAARLQTPQAERRHLRRHVPPRPRRGGREQFADARSSAERHKAATVGRALRNHARLACAYKGRDYRSRLCGWFA